MAKPDEDSSWCVYKSLAAASKALVSTDEDKSLQLAISQVLAQRGQPDLLREGHTSDFIVLEGIDASGKTTLAKSLEAEGYPILKTPPSSIASHRSVFDKQLDTLRRSFYSIGNYLALQEMHQRGIDKTVVFDRFYFSTVSYAVASQADTVEEMPCESNPVWKWPSDLARPKLIVLLSVNLEERRRRLALRAQQEELTDEEKKLQDGSAFHEKLARSYECCVSANPEIPTLRLDTSKENPKGLTEKILQRLTKDLP